VNTIKAFLHAMGRPRLVEFDYRDRTGLHHGRCYVSCFLAGGPRVKRMLSSLGYTNIHLA